MEPRATHSSHPRLDELDRQMRLYRAERAQHGLPAPASVPVFKEVCVAATDEQAVEIACPHLKDKYDAYVEWGQSDVLPPPPIPNGRVCRADRGRSFRARIAADLLFLLVVGLVGAGNLAAHVAALG
jgi:hypothetical protein